MRLLLPCLALAGLALNASAQSTWFGPSSGASIPWPAGSWGGGTVTRVASCDLDGDLYLDAVVLDGDEMVLAWGPGTFTARWALGGGVGDFCVVAGSAPTGEDGLFASDGSGWRTAWIDYGVPGYVDGSSTASTDWAGARSLLALTRPGSPPIVFGLDAAGARVLRLDDPFGTTPAGSQISGLGGVGLALALVDWNGVGARELAVLHDLGLDVYDIGAPSTPIASFTLATSTAPLDGGALTGFRQSGVAPTRLAAVIRPQSAPAELWVFDAGEVESMPLAVGSPANAVADPYTVIAGDVDGDGDDDLVVAHRDPSIEGPVLAVNLCAGSGPACTTFAPTATDFLDLGFAWVDESIQHAVPAFGDFTSDGDLDLAWFQQDALELRIAENTALDHADQLVRIQTSASKVLRDDEDGTYALLVRFVEPVTAPAFAADTILVQEWYQVAPMPAPTIHPVGVQAIGRPYPTSSSQWQNRQVLFLWPSFLPASSPVHLTIRAVRTDPVTAEVLEAGPASTHSVAIVPGAIDDVDGQLNETGQSVILFGAVAYDLPAFASAAPVGGWPTYLPGPFEDPDPNTYEGGGGGEPPRPPPLDEDDPPVAPTYP